MVSEAGEDNSCVKIHQRELRKFGDLRNAIVHDTTGKDVLAEPNLQTVLRIEKLRDLICNPPLLTNLKKEVASIQLSDSIATVARMMYEAAFSQGPVYENGVFRGLLTTDTIARWLGSCVGEGTCDLTITTVETVLKYKENNLDYFFISARSNYADILQIFQDYNSSGKRGDAVLITENGKETDKLVGIITVADIPAIYEKVLL